MDIENSADKGQQTEPTREELMAMIAKEGTTFQHILIYNALKADSLQDGIDEIKTMHEQLLSFHGFLTGFQFLGVSFEAGGDNGTVITVALFLLALGFICSGVGSIVSFIAIEYYNGIKGESPAMIVHGVARYWKFFYTSDLLAFLSTALFLVAVQVLVHSVLPSILPYIVNIVFLCMAIPAAACHFIIIPRRQRYASKIPGWEGKFHQRGVYGAYDDAQADGTGNGSRAQQGTGTAGARVHHQLEDARTSPFVL
mmetsp:Transcript_25793/g.43281  ORF Transcript_25793/g.43281 Transcript_25793/m.43281 type:complete len:255 (-) Transcript_25793:245-1009(-)